MKRLNRNCSLPIILHDFFNENSEGKLIEKHWHNSLEILIPLYGKFELWINGISKIVSAGNVYIVNSKDIHAINAVKNEKIYKGYALLIDYDYLKMCCSEIDIKFFQQPDEKINSRLMRTLIEIIRFYDNKGAYNDIRIRSYCQMLVYILLENLAVDKKGCFKLKDSKCKDRIVKIIKYIENNYQNDLSLSIIANQFDISEGYLAKIFKDNLNLTVKEYLNQIRLQHAKEDLVETDYPLIDIVYKNGFPNIKSFNKIFKELNNMSPKIYRNMMRK
ncbi:MAG: AraC family transcriptional regulator [Thomasclavelia sp.]